jgi:DNA-binding transcriptional ArsR family regulator
MEASSEDLVFKALADRSRRNMLDILKDRPGMTVGELADRFEMSRISAMKHLKVLERARLVVSEREGRCRRLYLNPVPIQVIHQRWTTQFTGEFARGLTLLRDQIEAKKERKRR